MSNIHNEVILITTSDSKDNIELLPSIYKEYDIAPFNQTNPLESLYDRLNSNGPEVTYGVFGNTFGTLADDHTITLSQFIHKYPYNTPYEL